MLTLRVVLVGCCAAACAAAPPAPSAASPDRDFKIVFSSTDVLGAGGPTYATGAWFGETIATVGGGTLQTFRFSVLHLPDAEGQGDPLRSCRVDVAFCDSETPEDPFGALSADLSFGTGLPAGEYGLCLLTDLSGLEIALEQKKFLMKLRLYEPVPPTAGELGQVACGPPTIGAAPGDTFWIDTTVADPPGQEHGWYWIGWPKPSLYAVIGVTNDDGFGPGDLNCDGVVDVFDVDPFVLVVTDPNPYTYWEKFPECDRMLADINGDGKIDAFDIDPFVQLLVSG